MRLGRWADATASALLASLTAMLAMLALNRACMPYENGRYYDPVESVVYHEGSAIVYALLALAFGLVTAVAIWRTIRRWKMRSP